MKVLKIFLKYLVLLLVGGSIYCGIEIIARGHTFFSMFIVGGICFILCGCVNEHFAWDTPLWLQMAICCLIITIIEFISGCLLNLALGLNVWDYSNQPFNVLGQICLKFSIGWYFLAAPAIILDDYIRYWFFGEEHPQYKLV